VVYGNANKLDIFTVILVDHVFVIDELYIYLNLHILQNHRQVSTRYHYVSLSLLCRALSSPHVSKPSQLYDFPLGYDLLKGSDLLVT